MGALKNIINSRNFKYGSVSVIITISVILFIVLLNAALAFLFARYPLNIDLTRNRVFEISKDTEDILAALDQDVTIYVMNSESGFVSASPQEYFIQANEVIRKYAQYSSRVRIEYVDLIRNPDFVSRYPGDQIRINDIIIASPDRHKVIFPSALFNVFSSEYGDYVASSRAEQAVTSALINVTSEKEFLALVLSGHGFYDVLSFLELLMLNNYKAAEINLLTNEIPAEASLIILANPARDLSPEELRKIDAFLNNGNSRVFFYLASVVQPEAPNLDEFLREWGIAVGSGLIFETDANRLISPSPYIAIVDYAEDKYSQNMKQRNLQLMFAQSRPLRTVFNEYDSRFVTPLLKFSGTSGIRPADAPNDWTVSPSYITGNETALFLSTQASLDADRNYTQNHVLVSGSVLALEESTLGNPYLANSAYFLDLFANLLGREDNFYIMDKIIGFTELRASYSQIIVIIVIFAVLLPLAVLGAGIAVWLRRRHK